MSSQSFGPPWPMPCDMVPSSKRCPHARPSRQTIGASGSRVFSLFLKPEASWLLRAGCLPWAACARRRQRLCSACSTPPVYGSVKPSLDVGDLDCGDRILTVRKGKFGKSRMLPLRESTVEALIRYLHHPARPVGTESSAPVFVSRLRRRLSYPTVSLAIYTACLAAGISKPLPRPHDFRHLRDWACRIVVCARTRHQCSASRIEHLPGTSLRRKYSVVPDR